MFYSLNRLVDSPSNLYIPKHIKTHINTYKHISNHHRYNKEDEDESNRIEKLHTNLTTYDAVRLYRSVAQKQITVFVKILPGSYIR